jgi:hypothetical protein
VLLRVTVKEISSKTKFTDAFFNILMKGLIRKTGIETFTRKFKI